MQCFAGGFPNRRLFLREDFVRRIARGLVEGDEVEELAADLGTSGGTFSMLALRAHVWLACGHNLRLFKGGKIARSWRLESPILGL